MSIGLLVANVLLFLWQQLHPEFTYGWSVIPREISSGRDIVGELVLRSGTLHLLESPSPVYLTIFSAMFFFRLVSVPAVLVLGMWALMQFVSQAGSLGATGSGGGVAYAAHIGGFVAGVAMGLLARATMKSEPDTVFRRQYEREPGVRRYW